MIRNSLALLALSIAAPLHAVAPVVIADKTDLLDFRYEWSREAAAIPTLDRRFRAEATKARREALATAREDRAARDPKLPWNGHSFERSWETMGQSPRLLSLLGSTSFYTGGAHPNGGTTALLWDRARGREIKLASLILPGQSWTGAIRSPFCTLLDRERSEKRGEKVVRGDWPNQCPTLDELTVVPRDDNANGRFDYLQVIADNYVAGPYVEGGYGFDLPVTAAMLARLRPEYRSSFEARPPIR